MAWIFYQSTEGGVLLNSEYIIAVRISERNGEIEVTFRINAGGKVAEVVTSLKGWNKEALIQTLGSFLPTMVTIDLTSPEAYINYFEQFKLGENENPEEEPIVSEEELARLKELYEKVASEYSEEVADNEEAETSGDNFDA